MCRPLMVVSSNFQAPTTLKKSSRFNHLFGGRVRWGLKAIIGRTVNNYVYLDRNLVE